MDKSNIHRKLTRADHFARHYYCQHAALNVVRSEKRYNKRWLRRYGKKLIKEEQNHAD